MKIYLLFQQIIFVFSPEKIGGSKIINPAYDELIKYIPGLILPSNPSEIVGIEFVSNPTLFIGYVHTYCVFQSA